MRAINSTLATLQESNTRKPSTRITVENNRLNFDEVFSFEPGDNDYYNDSCALSNGLVFRVRWSSSTEKIFGQLVNDLSLVAQWETWTELVASVADPTDVRCWADTESGTVEVCYAINDGGTHKVYWMQSTDNADTFGAAELAYTYAANPVGYKLSIPCSSTLIIADRASATPSNGAPTKFVIRERSVLGVWSTIYTSPYYPLGVYSTWHHNIDSILVHGDGYLGTYNKEFFIVSSLWPMDDYTTEYDTHIIGIHFKNGFWSDMYPLLQLDTSNETERQSAVRLSRINGEYWVTFLHGDPSAEPYDQWFCSAMRSSDLENWTDRFTLVEDLSDVGGTYMLNPGRIIIAGSYAYYVAARTVMRSLGCTLTGQNNATDISRYVTQWSTNFSDGSAGVANITVRNPDHLFDNSEVIAEGAEVVITAGYSVGIEAGDTTGVAVSYFTDDNDTSLDAYAPDAGSSWVEQVGAWDIQSNKAHCAGTAPTGSSWIATVDCAYCDKFTVQATIDPASDATAPGLVIRAIDVRNYISVRWHQSLFGGLLVQNVYKNGSRISHRAWEVEPTSPGDPFIMRIEVHDDEYKVYLDTILRASFYNSFNRSATKHGMIGSLDDTFDNFGVLIDSSIQRIQVGKFTIDSVNQANLLGENQLLINARDDIKLLKSWKSDRALTYLSANRLYTHLPSLSEYQENFVDISGSWNYSADSGAMQALGVDGSGWNIALAGYDRAANCTIETRFKFANASSQAYGAAGVMFGVDDSTLDTAYSLLVIGDDSFYAKKMVLTKKLDGISYTLESVDLSGIPAPAAETWYWLRVQIWYGYIQGWLSTNGLTWTRYVNFIDGASASRIIGDGLVGIAARNPPKTNIYDFEFVPANAGDLNDMTVSGVYTGENAAIYKIEIDGDDEPDTFKWSDTGGASWNATGVVIKPGELHALSNGISVKFNSDEGHRDREYWVYTVTPTILHWKDFDYFLVYGYELPQTTETLTRAIAAKAGITRCGFDSAFYDHFDTGTISEGWTLNPAAWTLSPASAAASVISGYNTSAFTYALCGYSASDVVVRLNVNFSEAAQQGGIVIRGSDTDFTNAIVIALGVDRIRLYKKTGASSVMHTFYLPATIPIYYWSDMVVQAKGDWIGIWVNKVHIGSWIDAATPYSDQVYLGLAAYCPEAGDKPVSFDYFRIEELHNQIDGLVILPGDTAQKPLDALVDMNKAKYFINYNSALRCGLLMPTTTSLAISDGVFRSDKIIEDVEWASHVRVISGTDDEPIYANYHDPKIERLYSMRRYHEEKIDGLYTQAECYKVAQEICDNMNRLGVSYTGTCRPRLELELRDRVQYQDPLAGIDESCFVNTNILSYSISDEEVKFEQTLTLENTSPIISGTEKVLRVIGDFGNRPRLEWDGPSKDSWWI